MTRTQNLNSKLSPPGPSKAQASAVGITRSASTVRSGASAPVSIAGDTSRYRGGGYCVNC